MVDQERPLISIVTETFSPDINGVAMTLGMLVDQLKQQFKIQIIKPGRRTSSEAQFRYHNRSCTLGSDSWLP